MSNVSMLKVMCKCHEWQHPSWLVQPEKTNLLKVTGIVEEADTRMNLERQNPWPDMGPTGASSLQPARPGARHPTHTTSLPDAASASGTCSCRTGRHLHQPNGSLLCSAQSHPPPGMSKARTRAWVLAGYWVLTSMGEGGLLKWKSPLYRNVF